MPWELTVGVVALVVGLTALVVALVVLRRSRHRPSSPERRRDAAARPQRPQLAVVVNPSKASTRRAIETVRRLAGEAALPAPRFYETSVDDPGTGQAREAVRDGADVVIAAGGDGTVRAVAEGMLGTEVPMGIIPAGTGNLLARNLDLPLTDTQEALAVILGGVDRSIDVGRIRVAERPADADEEDDDTAHLFLVIAGLGFDAAMVADADDQLKDKMGWVAYFLAGARHLHGRRMATHITVDDEEPVETRLRSIMVGNCGRLPGGINLLPDASLDDGVLDVAAIDTRAGLAGWAQLFGEVVAQGMGVQNDLPAKIGRIDHVKARRATIRVEDGEQAQADGEVLGRAVQIETWVEPGALVVRAPA